MPRIDDAPATGHRLFIEWALTLVYALPMPTWVLLFSSLLYCTALPAAVYRWVDADGQTHFSDRPAQGAEPLAIRATSSAVNPSPAADADDPNVANPGPYAAFDIIAPGVNETLNQPTGRLSVSLLLDPPLLDGHRLELVLDGVAVAVQDAATQLALTGIPFGSHRLQAQARDAAGDVVARTAPRPFHLLQVVPPGALP